MYPTIPPILRDRPLLGGLVVPYATGMRDGAYEFESVDAARQLECFLGKVCQICGRGLSEIAAFVIYSAHVTYAGDRVMAGTGQAPIHPECVPYSVVACPFLARRGRRYLNADPSTEVWVSVDGYTVHKHTDGTPYVQIDARPLKVRPVAEHPALLRAAETQPHSPAEPSREDAAS